jgi:hypothetical protein
VIGQNGLDGDGGCFVQSMLFKLSVYNLSVFFVLSSQTSFRDIIFSSKFFQILTVLTKLADHPKSVPNKTCFRDAIHLSALVKALGPAKNASIMCEKIAIIGHETMGFVIIGF